MNVVEKALSSARFNRLIFWAGLAVLAAGALVIVLKFAGGSDNTSSAPEPGFHPTLPKAAHPLKNSAGVTVKTYWQLDPQVRSTIKTFIATAVRRENLDKSWATVAPALRKGYTYDSWRHANALPVVPYPHADISGLQFYLDYASNKEILAEVGVSAPEKYKLRPTTFQIGLVPVGDGAQKHWLVDYWMPRWTPPLPED
jgi:hypothetical protein